MSAVADRQMRFQQILVSEDQTIEIYSAKNSPVVSPVPTCHEDKCITHPDPVVRQAYDGCKLTYKFFKDAFGRNSIDNQGQPIRAVVHYQAEWGKKLSNAEWDPDKQMLLFGDGDGIDTQSYTSDYDIIGHELTHGIIRTICPDIEYSGQIGALDEHISDVFGIMIKQYSSKQLAKDSDWLIGDNTYRDTATRKITLRSMKEPSNSNVVKYPQPSHMRDLNKFGNDVHDYSGIPNHAFYLAATNIGGYSWKKVGKVWYEAMLNLKSNDNFTSFAQKTISAAAKFFSHDSSIIHHVVDAWDEVGISTDQQSSIAPSSRPLAQRVYRQPAYEPAPEAGAFCGDCVLV